MKGRAWKARYKTGHQHYKTCHGVNDHEVTVCGKDLSESWIYDQQSNALITCKKCKQKLG